MLCPSCGHVNFPGDDECARCLFALAPLDLPTGADAVESSVLHDTVAALKPKVPVTIAAEAALGLALHKMVEHHVGALLVVDGSGRLAGILTERDYLMKVVGLIDDYTRLPVRDFMTAGPESVKAEDILAFAVHKMDVGGYRHVPVVDDAGRPVGIISVRDVLRHVTALCGNHRIA
jgi:CBS domain-containing protein